MGQPERAISCPRQNYVSELESFETAITWADAVVRAEALQAEAEHLGHEDGDPCYVESGESGD